MFTFEELAFPIVTSAGVVIKRLLTCFTSEGMVALKSQMLFLLGVLPRINSMSSLKPMFNISSASSNTI